MQPYQLLEWLLILLMLILTFIQSTHQEKEAPRSKKDWLRGLLPDGLSIRMGPFRISFEGGGSLA